MPSHDQERQKGMCRKLGPLTPEESYVIRREIIAICLSKIQGHSLRRRVWNLERTLIIKLGPI